MSTRTFIESNQETKTGIYSSSIKGNIYKTLHIKKTKRKKQSHKHLND